jgi:hypothetical protein
VRRSELGRGGRLVAACLTAIWLGAGLAGLAMGLWLRRGVLPVLLGVLALGYAWLWLRVAVTGERQSWPRLPRTRKGAGRNP